MGKKFMIALLIVGVLGLGGGLVSSLFKDQCLGIPCIPHWLGIGFITIVFSWFIFFLSILFVFPAKRRAEKNGIAFPPLRSWMLPSVIILLVEIVLVIFIFPRFLP